MEDGNEWESWMPKLKAAQTCPLAIREWEKKNVTHSSGTIFRKKNLSLYRLSGI
jgi:hypothetical protein